MRWKARFGVVACAVALLAASPGSASVGGPRSPLVRYPELETNVAFWRDVFTKYTKRQIVFHDSVRLDVIWAVRDIGDIVDGPLSETRKRRAVRDYIDRETRRIATALRALAKGRRGPLEGRLEAVIAARGDLPGPAVLAGRVRAQRGLADELCGAVARARPLLDRMRRILEEHGVPGELASLPLVESGYRSEANSHAGAVGIWQFTRSTGRRFLHIDHVVDERRDPIAATEAAAKYLRENYEQLGSWPLAITAYNHGANGIAYAVRKLGTRNLATIVRRYRSRSFGFASRNFYAEFLAAVDVMAEADARCGNRADPEPAPARVRIDSYVSMPQLARAAGVDVATLARMNPALQPDVAAGKLYVPRGYVLNVPAEKRGAFERAYAALPATARHSAQLPYFASHRVRRGETLSEIAKAYGTSVAAIQRHNDIRDPRRLRWGTTLKVPVSRSASPAVARASVTVHRVARGETLSHIAKRYGVSVAMLQRYNGISDPRRLRTGQVIRVPSASQGPRYRTHRVGKGQTLSQIAHIYRTTVRSLQRFNGIRDPRKLRYGQVIKVPM
ncbi:MAG: LysM peptidoglycan-binding domain-containing protein [Deltaproteobacteria bacterium]|nr:MAG: LysM peptidoglycan-binding domain-containing protein [Deltaproteobacteria bacterium]